MSGQNFLNSTMKTAVIGSVLVLLNAIPSFATQVPFTFTVAQLESAISSTYNNTTNKLGGACQNTLSDCGIYGIALTGFTGSGATGFSVANYIFPTQAGASAWTGGVGLFGGVLSTKPAMGDNNAAGSGVTFITTNTHVVSTNSYTNLGVNAQAGNGLYNATTSLTFIVDVPTLAYGTTYDLTLSLLTDVLNSTTGAEGAKGSLSSVDMLITATPEPSTWVMLIGGLGAIAFFGRRRFQRNNA